MRTFRETLIKNAFEGDWPPWSTTDEVEAYMSREDARPEMVRAYELGRLHRERGLTADEKGELDALADSDGWFAQWGEVSRSERDMKEAWDRALGLTQ